MKFGSLLEPVVRFAPAVLLLVAFFAETLPIFTIPCVQAARSLQLIPSFRNRAFWFTATIGQTRVLFGLWGYCTLPAGADIQCTGKTWGFGLNLASLGLPAARGVRSKYTKCTRRLATD